MIIKPMLGEFELPCIESIRCLERRRLVGFGPPGLTGDLHQDLGTESLVVEIIGSLQGDDRRDQFLESVRALFNAGEPVLFVADILTATGLEKVLIEALDIEERNQWDRPLLYRLVLRRFVEPPAAPHSFDTFGLELDAELDLLAGLGLDGLELPDLLIELPEIGNPVKPLLSMLNSAKTIITGDDDSDDDSDDSLAKSIGPLTEKFTEKPSG
ncbi:MAG: hypothetical protein ACOX5Z_02440 [Desulfobulbus sp.]|jgi:hypothetical protein